MPDACAPHSTTHYHRHCRPAMRTTDAAGYARTDVRTDVDTGWLRRNPWVSLRTACARTTRNPNPSPFFAAILSFRKAQHDRPDPQPQRHDRDDGMSATTALSASDPVKMLRETFCVAQSAIGQLTDLRKTEHIARLQRLIDDCDRQRPLGPDGKHGDRHTATCGCEE